MANYDYMDEDYHRRADNILRDPHNHVQDKLDERRAEHWLIKYDEDEIHESMQNQITEGIQKKIAESKVTP